MKITKEIKKKKLHCAWSHIKSKCSNRNDKAYKNYGGRGITYEDRWTNFKNFYEDMQGSYREGLTLERINNDGNYTKGNCRWATRKEQMRNQRKTFRVDGVVAANKSEELGGKRLLIYTRIKNYKWDPEKALSTPLLVKRMVYKGETASQASIRLAGKTSRSLVSYRVKAGWTLKDAFTKPVKK